MKWQDAPLVKRSTGKWSDAPLVTQDVKSDATKLFEKMEGVTQPSGFSYKEKEGFVKRLGKQYYNTVVAQPAMVFATESNIGKAKVELSALKQLEGDFRSRLSKGLPVTAGEIEGYTQPYKRGSIGRLFGKERPKWAKTLWADYQAGKINVGEYNKETEVKKLQHAMQVGKAETIQRADISMAVSDATNLKDKAADILAGVSGFVTRLAVLKKAFPAAPPVMLWELENQVTGGTPGKGALTYGLFSAPRALIKGASVAAKTSKLASESAILGGMTAIEEKLTTGEVDWSNVAISAAIPIGMRTPGFVKAGLRLGSKKLNRTLKNTNPELIGRLAPQREVIAQQGAAPAKLRQFLIDKKATELYDSMLAADNPKLQRKISKLIQGQNLPTLDSLYTRVNKGDKVAAEMIQSGLYSSSPESFIEGFKVEAAKQLGMSYSPSSIRSKFIFQKNTGAINLINVMSHGDMSGFSVPDLYRVAGRVGIDIPKGLKSKNKIINIIKGNTKKRVDRLTTQPESKKGVKEVVTEERPFPADVTIESPKSAKVRRQKLLKLTKDSPMDIANIPTEIDTTISAINNWATKAKLIEKKEWQPALKQLRARQIQGGNQVLNIAKDKGAMAEKAIRSAQKGFKIKAIRPEVEPPKLSDSQWNSISAKAMDVYKAKGEIFKLTNTQKALDNLRFYRKIPTNYEFGLLEPILGTKTVAKLYERLSKLRTYGKEDIPELTRDGLKSMFGYDPQAARSLRSIATRHPIVYLESVGKNIIGYYGGKTRANKLLQKLADDPALEAGKKAGVSFLGLKPWTATHQAGTKLQQYGTWTDFLLSRKNRTLQTWGKVFAASERGATIGINTGMLKLTKQALKHADRMSKRGYSQAQIDKYMNKRAKIINSFTKRVTAKHPKIVDIQRAANWVLFSPAHTVSRPVGTWQSIANLFASGSGNRTYAMELTLTNIASIAAIGSIAKYVGNKYRTNDPTKEPPIDGAYDPTDSLWGKVRSGNDVIDMSGGDASWYRLLARIGVSAYMAAKGKIKDEEYIAPKAGEEILRYFQSRETVILGLMKTLTTKKDWVGEPISRTEALLKQIPFEALVSIIEAGEADGLWEALAAGDGSEVLEDILTNIPIGVAGLSGMGTMSYTVNPASTRVKYRNIRATEEYDKTWDELNRLEQAKLSHKYRLELKVLDEEVAKERIKKPFNPDRLIEEQQKAGDRVRLRLSKSNRIMVKDIPINIGRSPEGIYLNDTRYNRYIKLVTTYLDERLSQTNIDETKRIEVKKGILELAVNYSKTKAFAQLQKEGL